MLEHEPFATLTLRSVHQSIISMSMPSHTLETHYNFKETYCSRHSPLMPLGVHNLAFLPIWPAPIMKMRDKCNRSHLLSTMFDGVTRSRTLQREVVKCCLLLHWETVLSPEFTLCYDTFSQYVSWNISWLLPVSPYKKNNNTYMTTSNKDTYRMHPLWISMPPTQLASPPF